MQLVKQQWHPIMEWVSCQMTVINAPLKEVIVGDMEPTMVSPPSDVWLQIHEIGVGYHYQCLVELAKIYSLITSILFDLCNTFIFIYYCISLVLGTKYGTAPIWYGNAIIDNINSIKYCLLVLMRFDFSLVIISFYVIFMIN